MCPNYQSLKILHKIKLLLFYKFWSLRFRIVFQRCIEIRRGHLLLALPGFQPVHLLVIEHGRRWCVVSTYSCITKPAVFNVSSLIQYIRFVLHETTVEIDRKIWCVSSFLNAWFCCLIIWYQLGLSIIWCCLLLLLLEFYIIIY